MKKFRQEKKFASHRIEARKATAQENVLLLLVEDLETFKPKNNHYLSF